MAFSLFSLVEQAGERQGARAYSRFFANRLFSCILLLTAAGYLLPVTSSTFAANGTWSATSVDAIWTNANNWSASPAPGTGDTATFNNAGNGNTTISLAGSVTNNFIIFDTSSAAAYTIGSGGAGAQTLRLNSTGAIGVYSTVVNSQLFNANLILGTDGTTQTMNWSNAAAGVTLTFAGTIQGGSGGTAGAKTLNVNTTGSVTFQNAITAGGASSVRLINTGAGTLTLSGAVSSSLDTLRASTSGGIVVVDGQTVTVASSSTYGSTGIGQTGRFDLRSGSVNFNGGLVTAATASDGSLFRISGGIFTASTVTIAGRTWGNSAATATTATPNSSGFVVTNGSAAITGNLALNGNNSNVSGLLSNGTLWVGGEIRIGDLSSSASSRWNVFQVAAGSLTCTDAVNGVVIARANANASNGSLYLTGGTTTVEKISFGIATTVSGSAGNLELSGAGAALFVGSGGISNQAVNPFTATVNLTSGTLGAKANWSSPLAMTLAGNSVTIKAADAADVAHDITLSGILSGANGFTKTGGGNLTLTGTNSYSGNTTISAGTLTIGGSGGLGSGSYAGLITNNGILVYSSSSNQTFNGAMAGTTGQLYQNNSASTLLLTGTNTYSGNITVSAGTLTIGGAGALGDISGSYAGLITNNAILVHSSSSNQTFSSELAGNGQLFQNNSGSALILTGTNSYTGNITVSAGTLTIGGAGALGGLAGSYAGQITNNATLVHSSSSNQTLSGAIAGTGLIVQKNSGSTLTFSGASTFSGNISNVAGWVSLGANDSLGASTLVMSGGTLASAGAFSFTNAVSLLQNGTFDTAGGNITVSGVVSGASALIKVGAGTLILAGNNTYSGNTSNSAGMIRLGAANVLPDGTGKGNVFVNGTGILDLNTFSETINGFSGNGTVDTVAGGTPTLTVGNNDVNSTWSGTITNSAGALKLAKIGAGTFSLTAANAYSGGTVLAGGTLVLARNNDFGTGGIGTGTNTFQGGILSHNYSAASTLVYNNPTLVDTAQTGTIATPQRFRLNGDVIGAGTLNIQINTSVSRADFQNDFSGFSGTLNLTGSGTVRLGIQALSGGQPTFNGAGWAQTTLSVDGVSLSPSTFSGGDTISIGALTSTGNAGVLGGGLTGRATYSVGGKNLSTTFAGSIQGNSALTKVGTGSLTLTGTNTYDGTTTISAGQLVLANANAITNSIVAVNVAGGLAFSNDTSFLIGGLSGTSNFGLTNTDANAITLNTGNTGGTNLYGGVMSGSGALTKIGTGRLTLSNANTYIGLTTINGGQLVLGNTNAVQNSTVSNMVSGGLVFTNFSRFNLGGLAGTGNFGLTNTAGASVTLIVGTNNADTTYSGAMSGAGSLVKIGSGTLTLSGGNTYSGATIVSNGTLAAGADFIIANTSSLSVASGATFTNNYKQAVGSIQGAGNIILGVAGVLSNGFDNTSTSFSGVISGAGALAKYGTGALILGATNTYTGATIVNAGTLAAGAATVISAGSAVTVGSGATLNFGAFNQNIGSLAGLGTVTNNAVLNVGFNTTSASFGGLLSGTGSIIKSGTGTQELTGANTYSGDTTISNGLLKVNNTLGSGTGSGNVNVFSNATLGGIGAIGGQVTINSGGVYAPGNSVGTQTNGALTLASGSILNFEFTGSLNDQIIVTNNNGLTINGGGFNLYQPGGTTTYDTHGVYNLIGYTGTIGNSYTNLSILNQVLNRRYLFATNGTFITLTIGGSSGWSGGPSGDSYWTNAANWSGSAPVDTDDLLFDGNTRLNNTNKFTAGTHFTDIVFTNTAGAFVLNGNTVNLLGNIINLSTNTSNTQTINLPLVLDGGNREINASNGDLIVNGVISDSGGSFGLVKTGTNKLSLAGANLFGGGVIVSNGTLLANSTTGSATGPGSVQVLGGATLGGTGIVAGAVTIASGGTLAPSTGGTLTLQSAPTLNGTAVINNNATLNVTPAWSNPSTVRLLGGTVIGGNLTNEATVNGYGSLATTLINQSQVTATNGELRLLGVVSGTGAYQAVAGTGASTLTFVGGGEISALFNTVATVRVEGLLTNNSVFVNSGTLNMGGGTYQTTTRLTNDSAAWITGYGTINSTGALLNQGTILANGGVSSPLIIGGALTNAGWVRADNGALVVSGIFTNNGTVSFLNSVGTFNSAVVNSGAWITDPTTNIYQSTYTLTSSGSISMTPGDVFIFTNNGSTVGTFINNSTQSNTTAMLPGKFLFDSTLNLTQKFATAGDNIGSLDTGGGFNTVTVDTLNTSVLGQYSNNFTLGTLELSGVSTTMVYDSFLVGGRSHSGLQAGLFLDTLTINPGTFLIISNNVQVYFINSNGFSQAQVQLLGTSGLHQLVTTTVIATIPEPNVLMMWLAGLGTLYAARRRRRTGLKK